MILTLLLSAALAAPCRAVISHGEAPEAAPESPIWHDFPTASVTSQPDAAAASIPALPAALPASEAAGADASAAAAGPQAQAGQPAASPSGMAAVGQAMAGVLKAIVPDIQTSRKGGDGDAASAGDSIQDALEGERRARGGAPSVFLPIYERVTKTGPTMAAAMEGNKVVSRPLLDPALDTSSAQAAAYRYAYASAADAAKRAKLPKPRFVEAWREKGGWTFHFVAGGRYLRVYARDGHQPADRAWMPPDEYAPSSSLGLSPMQFSQKIGPQPRWALKEAAKRLKVPEESLGLSLVTLPRSNSLWYLIDAEDGRRLAYNMNSGNSRRVEQGALGRDKIEAAVRALAIHKGYPYSQTEYRAAYSGYVGSLREDGATRAQLALFERLMDAVPVKGGRFNSWAGE